jgi:L-amino acid N-acyltransferase YncA
VIRVADPALDGASCAEIYAPYVSGSYFTFESTAPDAAETAARISTALDAHAWVVAEVGGDVKGYAYAAPHATRDAYRWACSTAVYVKGDSLGRGIGPALYGALLERVAARGYLTATAGITLPNERSVSMHEKFGFREAARYRRIGYKLGAWHDVIWMQRDLVAEGTDFPVPPPEPGR